VNERLVAVEETVATAENVTLEPALARVLRENFHNAAGVGQVTTVAVFLEVLAHPDFLCHLVHPGQLVGLGLVGAKETEVVHVETHDVPQEAGHVGHAAGHGDGGLVDLDGVVAEIGHLQGLLDAAAAPARSCASTSPGA
jgi:hypothetical protein